MVLMHKCKIDFQYLQYNIHKSILHVHKLLNHVCLLEKTKTIVKKNVSTTQQKVIILPRLATYSAIEFIIFSFCLNHLRRNSKKNYLGRDI